MQQHPSPEFVTQIISRKARPEHQSHYESWLRDRLLPTLASFPGYQGATVLRPQQTATQEYVVIQRWENYAALRHWCQSPEREKVLAESEPYTEGAPIYHQQETGLELWFQLPGESMIRPPPRYKMAFLIWMVIAPLTYLTSQLAGPLLQSLPNPVAIYLRAGVVVLLMTYAVMPLVTRLTAGWLKR